MAYFLLPKNVTQRVFEVPMVDIEPSLGNFYRIYRSRHNENWPGDISVNFRLCLVRLLGTSKTQTLFLLQFLQGQHLFRARLTGLRIATYIHKRK